MSDRYGDSASGNAWKLALAWIFVGVPLTWGVIQTCLNALLLFK